jgi:DNA-directed RNA polymerase specialized sigma24 family protein
VAAGGGGWRWTGGTAYLLTGNHASAEDLLQTTLLKVYLAWSRIRDLGAVEDYTRTTMVRTQVSFCGGR